MKVNDLISTGAIKNVCRYCGGYKDAAGQSLALGFIGYGLSRVEAEAKLLHRAGKRTVAMIWMQVVMALCGVTLAVASETWLGRVAGIVLTAAVIAGVIVALYKRRSPRDIG